MTVLANLKKPYLILLGDVDLPEDAKTGFGLAQWRREWCLGQVRVGEKAANIGLPDLTVEEAIAKGAKSLVIGVAPIGGGIHDSWVPTLINALERGMDVISGMHTSLNEIPRLSAAANRGNTRIYDIRKPQQSFGSGSPKKRSGKRLLTVGTDCAVGKKYTALALSRALAQTGRSVEFCATGQTGLLIAERGIVVDAVVSDFLVGAAAALSPNADDEHLYVIEGQGSLFHPIYGGVTLGLLYGSQPDYIWLCHKAGNTHLMDYPEVPIPALETYVEAYLQMARVVNDQVRLAGMSFNTASMSGTEREKYLSSMQSKFSVPCIDPLISDLTDLSDNLI